MITDVAAGGNFSIFVTTSRIDKEVEVFGTGFNVFGELGLGIISHVSDVTKIERLSNFQVKDEKGNLENVKVDQIECGSNHCMLLFNLGAILEWGANEYGQMGKN